MLYYAIGVVIFKYFIQLLWWADSSFIIDFYNNYESVLKIGFFYCPTTSELFSYILPEILIIFCILLNIYQENLIGMYDKREIEVETIYQAR